MKPLIKNIIEESKKTPMKWMNYLMLIFLFGFAFILPAYGLREQTRQSSAQVGDEQNTEEGKGKSEKEKGTIVIDAGHGGFDGGMVGSSGITEKVLNLVYARKLEALLTEQGYHVVQTRTTEDGLYDEDQTHKKAQDMQRRCAIIEEEQPLLTVSIHQNSYPDAFVCGPQVFYYEQSKEGENLAACIQNCLNAVDGVPKQRVQKGNSTYYILRCSASVTVIVECGFLTNAAEEALLQDEKYQDKIVQAICDGVLEYLKKG